MTHNSKRNLFGNQEAQRLSRSQKTVVYLPNGRGGFYPVEIESAEFTVDAQGNPQETKGSRILTNIDGKILTKNFLGFYVRSWTGNFVSYYDHGLCEMCANEYLRKRYVFLGIDGVKTEFGNCICTECLEVNERRKSRLRRSFGLIPQTIY